MSTKRVTRTTKAGASSVRIDRPDLVTLMEYVTLWNDARRVIDQARRLVSEPTDSPQFWREHLDLRASLLRFDDLYPELAPRDPRDEWPLKPDGTTDWPTIAERGR